MAQWNTQTWSRLLRRYSGPLNLYAAQRCSHPEDVVQEAFLELFKLAEPPENLSAWLFTVVRNKSYSARRTERRRANHEQQSANPQSLLVEESLDNRLDADEVSRLVGELSEEEREIVILKLWGELTFDEIAALTTLSASTCHRRYQDALEQIKQKMGVSCPNSNR